MKKVQKNVHIIQMNQDVLQLRLDKNVFLMLKIMNVVIMRVILVVLIRI
jgi:hypothetical protein